MARIYPDDVANLVCVLCQDPAGDFRMPQVDADGRLEMTTVAEAHATSHEDGGSDEINVAGLSGDLADAQDPKAHHASHEDGGSDEINVAGLSGETAALGTHKADADAHHSADAGVEFIIDGSGAAITTGEKGHLELPFACTIDAGRLFADQSGSIQIDIWNDTYAAFPPTDADSICGGNELAIAAAQKAEDTTLTGWTVDLAKGSVLAFNVDSCTTIERVTVSLSVTRS